MLNVQWSIILYIGISYYKLWRATLKLFAFLFYDKAVVMGRFNFFFDSLAVLTVCNVWAILSEMNDKIARE